jgi:tRNA threonylcarbamoyladenosine biosynthesis protein TsaB
MPEMLTLGVETSGKAGTVALRCDGNCLEERSLDQSGRRHARSLVAEIAELFRGYGFPLRDTQLVAVSIGPGSFTGLRVGVVCAKTLAYSTGCQLAAIDTFLSIAENSPLDVTELSVISDAQRGELFLGRYCRDSDRSFVREGEIEIVNQQVWCEKRSQEDVVSGPGAEQFRDRLANRCRVLEAQFCHPRADVVAKLGERHLNQETSEDFWSLEPFYIRKSAAEEKWDRDHS